MGVIKFQKVKSAPTFRKIALGSWNSVGDPSVYGLIELEMSPALKYIEETDKRENVKITPSHLVGKAVAQVLKQRPEINGMIRLGRLYLRESVDVFYQVNIPGREGDPIGKANLSGTVIRAADKLSVAEISRQLTQKSEMVRTGKDKEINRSLSQLSLVPWRLMKTVLNVSSFLNYDFNWNLNFLGFPSDPFGSVMITNVGGMGVEVAWAPLVPFARVPLLLTVGAIRPTPWAVGNKVEVRPVMKIGVTFDHRFIDGSHAAAMSYQFKKCFEDPETYLV